MLVALLARGHALLVGVPGLAKTLLVASLARGARPRFRPRAVHARPPAGRHHRHRRAPGGRGQAGRRPPARALPARPDLPQPHPRRRDQPHAAEDAGRAPPGDAGAAASPSARVTHTLPDPFQVFATRNPIEQEGTYPLPEAQLDRFLLEIHVDYPSETEEREIARRTTSADVGTVPRVLSTARGAGAPGARPAHSRDRRGRVARRRASAARRAPGRRRRPPA